MFTAEDAILWWRDHDCNGFIDVFLEPAEGAMATAGAIRQAIDEQRAVVPITVVESPDRASVRPGTRMLVHADGTGEGSLGDRELDRMAVGEARAALREGRSGLISLAESV